MIEQVVESTVELPDELWGKGEEKLAYSMHRKGAHITRISGPDFVAAVQDDFTGEELIPPRWQLKAFGEECPAAMFWKERAENWEDHFRLKCGLEPLPRPPYEGEIDA